MLQSSLADSRSFDAAISACEKGTASPQSEQESRGHLTGQGEPGSARGLQWQRACQLIVTMRRESCLPGVRGFSAALSACAPET